MGENQRRKQKTGDKRMSKICFICEMVTGTRSVFEFASICEDCHNIIMYDILRRCIEAITYGSSSREYGQPFLEYKRKKTRPVLICGTSGTGALHGALRSRSFPIEILGTSTDGMFVDEYASVVGNPLSEEALQPYQTLTYQALDQPDICDEDFKIENRKKDYQTPRWQKVGNRRDRR
jgi:hypothetical protein